MPEYLTLFLNSPLGFGQAAVDVGGSVAQHVNIRSIRRFVMPLPPTGEQNRIVAAFEQMERIVDRLDMAISQRERIGAQLGAAIGSHSPKS